MEHLLLNVYLGYIVFVVSAVVFVFITKKLIKSKLKIALLTILQFIISCSLSLVIWRFWIFPFDIMLGFISLPAVIAEVVTILTIYLIITKTEL